MESIDREFDPRPSQNFLGPYSFFPFPYITVSGKWIRHTLPTVCCNPLQKLTCIDTMISQRTWYTYAYLGTQGNDTSHHPNLEITSHRCANLPCHRLPYLPNRQFSGLVIPLEVIPIPFGLYHYASSILRKEFFLMVRNRIFP